MFQKSPAHRYRNLGRVRIAGPGYPTRICFPHLQPVWAYQREARLQLVTPIYHAEASAQAEALASATTGSQASKSQQGQRSGGGLRNRCGAAQRPTQQLKCSQVNC